MALFALLLQSGPIHYRYVTEIVSSRTKIAELQESVTRLRSATVSHLSSFADDAPGFMATTGDIPDAWQAEVLLNTKDNILKMCARQTGKSTTVAAKATHVATYEPGALILLAAPTQRQAQELLYKCVFVHRTSGEVVKADHTSALRMELANGSRIIALPGTEATVRGYSGPRLVLLDEAAWIPDSFFHAVSPMLAVSGGQMIAMTTPGGKRGWFWREWTEGAADYRRFKITAADCPRIDPAFLKRERRRMPHNVYQAEYECEFTDTVDSVFRYSDIEKAFTSHFEPMRFAA